MKHVMIHQDNRIHDGCARTFVLCWQGEPCQEGAKGPLGALPVHLADTASVLVKVAMYTKRLSLLIPPELIAAASPLTWDLPLEDVWGLAEE